MTGPAVELVSLTTGYVESAPVLEDVTLTIPEHGAVRLVGPNGIGKSTVVEVLSGYLRPWSGRARVLGRVPHDPALRPLRAVMRAQSALYPYMTVRDHLVLASSVRGVSPAYALARLEELGAGPWLDQNAGTLSSGSRHKAWFVMCTLHDAELVILDEPFNAVDAQGVEAMVAWINGVARDRTVVLVSHQLPAGLHLDRTVEVSSNAPR